MNPSLRIYTACVHLHGRRHERHKVSAKTGALGLLLKEPGVQFCIRLRSHRESEEHRRESTQRQFLGQQHDQPLHA